MILKLAKFLGAVKDNYKEANKEPLKWLFFIVASITIPATLEIKVATTEMLRAVELDTKEYVDGKHSEVMRNVTDNHKELIDKLNEMSENIKTLDHRVYNLNQRK